LVFSNLLTNIIPVIFLYMLVYNLTLIGFFWILMSFHNSSFKTLFSFNTFSFNSSYLLFLTIFLFSLAGVPPFIGFFSKVYLLNLLVEQSFSFLFCLFIVLLIFGLYFYVQNLRFLHSTNVKSLNKTYMTNERYSFVMFYYLITLSFMLINGVFIVEDLLLYFIWLLY